MVYLGHSLTWEKGRQLKTFDTNTYTYNANGIRTGKTVNGILHTYTLDGTNILREEWNGNTLIPLRDNEESVCGILYNDTPFYFLKNLQGDIIAITDANGDTVARYAYDAWGKCTISSDTSTCNIATVNPYRYRGYYYDEEIAMYYLQSRYYDPEVGRFINADKIDISLPLSIGCFLHLFWYCDNSPINAKDSFGLTPETVLDVIGIVWSLVDLISNPTWSNFGYLVWDIASAFVPILPGSYIKKGGKLIAVFCSKIDDFARGSRFLADTYNNLKKLYRGIRGIEIHHIIEKRFRKLFKVATGSFLSVPLTKELHKVITKRWRNLYKVDDYFRYFRYGANYSKITYAMMKKAIKEVYKDMPELLDAALKWFQKNWRK